MAVKVRLKDTSAQRSVPHAHSDRAAMDLLKRIKAATDPAEVKRLSDQLERVIFHKQYKNE